MASSQSDINERLVLCTALAYVKHRLPVKTVLMLLRPEALHSSVTGAVNYDSGQLHYRVVPLWEMSAETARQLPTALLPLGTIGNIAQEDLPEFIAFMTEFLRRDRLSSEREADLWAETFLILGVKYDRPVIRDLLKGMVQKMRESTTYQAIVEEGIDIGIPIGREEGRVEGRAEGERISLLVVGRSRFGEPDDRTLEALDQISEPERLLELVQRALTVDSWHELLR